MPSFYDLQVEQRLALIHFLRQCTVPLVAEANHACNVVGTGTLFDFGDGPSLITANHVLQGEDYGLQDLAIPDTPDGISMTTLGSLDLRKEKTQDIAILRFKTPETMERMTRNWHVLSGADIELSLPNSPLAIAGCPRELAVPRKTMLHAGWIVMFVDRCTPSRLDEQLAVEEGLAQPMDFDAEYPTNVFRHDGSSATTPESVRGLSSGSVWQMVDDITGIWTPRKAMRIVGMQVTAAPGKFERVRSWKTVSEVYYFDRK